MQKMSVRVLTSFICSREKDGATPFGQPDQIPIFPHHFCKNARMAMLKFVLSKSGF
jgi:hypothetical protein